MSQDRSKALFRMNRQFGDIKMMKRAGRGAFQDGIASTGPGELAVRCPACPRPGVNLPDGWESLPASEQYVVVYLLTANAEFHIDIGSA